MTDVVQTGTHLYLCYFDRTMDQSVTTPPPGWLINSEPVLTWNWSSATTGYATVAGTAGPGYPYSIAGGVHFTTTTGGPVQPSTGTTTTN